jgi:hypothetical protein
MELPDWGEELILFLIANSIVMMGISLIPKEMFL